MVLLNGLASSSSFWSGRSSEGVLQLGVTFAWLLFWLAPVVREILRARNPAAWPLPAPGPLARSLFRDGNLLRNGTHAHLASNATPLVALVFTQAIWGFQEVTLAGIAFGGAVLYAFAAFSLRRIEVGRLAYTQALVALLLLTLSFVLALEGNALLFVLAAEAAILHYVAFRLRDRLLSAGAHSLFFVAATWLGIRLASGAGEDFHTALVDLAVIALAFGASCKVVPGSTVSPYRGLAHLAALAWLARELLPLPDGDTWTLLSWALYAAGLYVLSRRLPNWGTVVGTHVLSAAVAVWLGVRLTGVAAPGVALLDPRGIADLAIIALLALAALVVPPLPPRGSIHAYRLAAHVAFLAWLWRELSALPGGDAYVTIAWGVYAAALFIVGLRSDHVTFVRGGLATLFLVVGKLFLVDLAQVDTVWRVLLFLGFGGLFLALSYYLRSLWRPGAVKDRR